MGGCQSFAEKSQIAKGVGCQVLNGISRIERRPSLADVLITCRIFRAALLPSIIDEYLTSIDKRRKATADQRAE